MFKVFDIEKYDEKLFTTLFEITNKIHIEKFFIDLDDPLKEDLSNIYSKVKEKIESFQTTKIISKEVS